MPWIKLDDSFLTNAKIMQAGIDARALYIAGLCHCGKTLSDGMIPRAMVAKLAALADVGDAASAVATLLALELWHEHADAFEVHDYLDYNPTRQQAESNAAQRAISGALGGKRSGVTRRAKQTRSNLLRADDGSGDGATGEAESKQIAKQNAKQTRSNLRSKNEAKDEPVSRIPYPVIPSPDPVPDPHAIALPIGAGDDPIVAPQAARDAPDRALSKPAKAADSAKQRRAELVGIFESELWHAWPLKRNKQQAQVAFVRLMPTDDEIAAMLEAIPAQSRAYDWPRESYRYVPYLATWLNQRRWEDDTSLPPPDYAQGRPLGVTTGMVSDQTLAWFRARRDADPAFEPP